MSELVYIPNIGSISIKSGFKLLDITSNNEFTAGKNGVNEIAATGDGKVEFVCFDDKSIVFVKSGMGYPLRKGHPGALGELSPKPHPWLYADNLACRPGGRISGSELGCWY